MLKQLLCLCLCLAVVLGQEEQPPSNDGSKLEVHERFRREPDMTNPLGTVADGMTDMANMAAGAIGAGLDAAKSGVDKLQNMMPGSPPMLGSVSGLVGGQRAGSHRQRRNSRSDMQNPKPMPPMGGRMLRQPQQLY